MSMKELEELFLHELKDIYDAESRLVDATEKMARESVDPEIRQAFRDHHEETMGQVERVREVFKVLGKRAQRETCAGIVGLIKEHSSVVKELEPKGHVMDLINLAAAQKVERYEITAYEGLIHLAETLGHDKEVVDLLNENLMEEQAAFDKVHSLQEDYDVQAAADKQPDESPRRSGNKANAPRGRAQEAVVGGNKGGSRTSKGNSRGGSRSPKTGAKGGNKRKSTKSR